MNLKWVKIFVLNVIAFDCFAFCRDEMPKVASVGDVIGLTVDCEKPLAEMIADGHYNRVSDFITARRFPVTCKGKSEAKSHIVTLHQKATSREVEIFLNANGLKPATIEQLLAFGEKFPDSQRKSTIVVLGKTVNRVGGRYAIYLNGNETDRFLGLDWNSPDDIWEAGSFFLAVNK